MRCAPASRAYPSRSRVPGWPCSTQSSITGCHWNGLLSRTACRWWEVGPLGVWGHAAGRGGSSRSGGWRRMAVGGESEGRISVFDI